MHLFFYKKINGKKDPHARAMAANPLLLLTFFEIGTHFALGISSLNCEGV